MNFFTRENITLALAMPISLDSLGAACGYIQFSRPEGIFPLAPKEVTLLVSTNRGRKLKLAVELHPGSMESDFQ